MARDHITSSSTGTHINKYIRRLVIINLKGFRSSVEMMTMIALLHLLYFISGQKDAKMLLGN